MKRRSLVAHASLATAFFCTARLALAEAGGALGVILMHGKGSSPQRSRGLRDIAAKLDAGIARTVVPAMPWSEGNWERISVTPEQAFGVIDDHAARLRSQGAQRIVVVGQSLGANMALAYAVSRQTVAGVVMAAPGHNPAFSYRSIPAIKDAVDRAAALTLSGQGSQPFEGEDSNQGTRLRLSTTARVYIAWMSPRGAASMPAQAPLLPASIPLMLVIGTSDRAYGMAEASIYKPAARHPYSQYLAVNAGHGDTDHAAAQRIFDWIKGLPAR